MHLTYTDRAIASNANLDYLPRKPSSETNIPFLFWLIRRVEVTNPLSSRRIVLNPS